MIRLAEQFFRNGKKYQVFFFHVCEFKLPKVSENCSLSELFVREIQLECVDKLHDLFSFLMENTIRKKIVTDHNSANLC